ncbi:uncharacterized protein LOC128229324 isoform X2 [Mya arenaria]|uniref:uncharacterized protein LOC128229324 isoform X2 n=1 Tax=Mya arenaria TaxID=6604 RepID=UPI0022E14599|nr:uncharacterized protein LOC128229324 isoform X2 [Mya arenaria]
MGVSSSFLEFPSRPSVEERSLWYQNAEAYPIERILNDLDTKIKEWNDIIDNLKKGQMSGETKVWMFSQMIQTSDFLISMVPPEYYTSFRKQGADQDQRIPYEHRHQQVPRHQEGHQSAHEGERRIRRDNAPQRPQTASPGGRNNELEKLKRENKELQTSLKDVQLVGEDLQREKELLLTRLSRFAGEKLTADNPNIADLSDPCRPTRLGEQYSEIYDNEWTNAFEGLLDCGYSQSEAIDTLKDTLMNIDTFCNQKADMVLKKAEDSVNLLFEDYTKSVNFKVNLNEQSIDVSAKKKHMFSDVLNSATMGAMGLQKRWLPKGGNQPASLSAMQTKLDIKPVNIEDKLKKLRKEVSSSIVPIVQRAYIEAFWNRECIPVLKPFVKACLHLCWKMVVQSPPMRFKLVTKGQRFDANLFKEYTLSGTTVDFVVWPALLLHDGGPLIAKGIAQPVGRNKIGSSEQN